MANAHGGNCMLCLVISRRWRYVRDVVGRHAHEEDCGSVGVDVAVHPLCPRLEHLPVRHRPVHQGVLAPPCRPLVIIPQSTTSFSE